MRSLVFATLESDVAARRWGSIRLKGVRLGEKVLKSHFTNGVLLQPLASKVLSLLLRLHNSNTCLRRRNHGYDFEIYQISPVPDPLV